MSEITGAQYRTYLSAHLEGQLGGQSKAYQMTVGNAEDPHIPFLVVLGVLDGRTNNFPRSREDLAEKLVKRTG